VVQAVAGSSPVTHPDEVAAKAVLLGQANFRSARAELPMSYQFFGGAGDFEVPEPWLSAHARCKQARQRNTY
jgi:hypothetical protein